jgi:hypothetical protein
VYTYIHIYIHLHHREQTRRTGLALAELVRRAIDSTYRPEARSRVRGFEVSLGLWERPDAAVVGRRPRRL